MTAGDSYVNDLVRKDLHCSLSIACMMLTGDSRAEKQPPFLVCSGYEQTLNTLVTLSMGAMNTDSPVRIKTISPVTLCSLQARRSVVYILSRKRKQLLPQFPPWQLPMQTDIQQDRGCITIALPPQMPRNCILFYLFKIICFPPTSHFMYNMKRLGGPNIPDSQELGLLPRSTSVALLFQAVHVGQRDDRC